MKSEQKRVFAKSRVSSILHEIARGLAINTKIDKKKILKQQLIKQDVLKMNGICEYCELNAAGKRCGDHYKPLVVNQMPTIYCHEPINIIPVCSKCNSSKQGRDFFTWYTRSEYCKSFPRSTRNRVLKKMRLFDKAFKKEHTKKKVCERGFKQLHVEIVQFLESIDNRLHKIRGSTKFTSTSCRRPNA